LVAPYWVPSVSKTLEDRQGSPKRVDVLVRQSANSQRVDRSPLSEPDAAISTP
jgi:hypothetical protein